MREFVSSTGIVIKVGQNDKENDLLIKTSHQDHIWCHLENLPSPHAVIESPEPDPETVNEALQLVKYYSKAKETNNIRTIQSPVRELRRVSIKKPGLVELKKAPKKKNIKTDIASLNRLGVIKD